MTQEALKLALECAERCEEIDGMYSWSATITAIKEALAQTQEPLIGCVNHDCEKCKAQMQEPVAWFRYQQGSRVYYDSKKWDDCQPLYTHPLQRTWVGLTDEDICMFSMWLDDKSDVAIFTAIEAKLKEKNGA